MPGKTPLTLLVLILCLVQPVAAGAPVSLRINTSHALGNAKSAVLEAGLKLNSDVQVTASSPDDRGYLPPDRFIEDAKSVGATILSSSFSGWDYLYDSKLYQKLTENGMLHVFAYEPRTPQLEGAPPPAAFTTVNRIGGMTGHGIEFGIPSDLNGKSRDATPSGATAHLAGLMASLKFQHPDWNWFDVKAALRSTAANFPAGYNPQNYGYGAIDYRAANALRSARKLPLFPPAAILQLQPGTLVISINPFQQTRRAADALFKFKSKPVPGTSELSLNEIVALGGQLVFMGDSAKSGNTASYRAEMEEWAYFVWFTKDAAGRFSRVEPYAILGPVHLVPLPLYGPRR